MRAAAISKGSLESESDISLRGSRKAGVDGRGQTDLGGLCQDSVRRISQGHARLEIERNHDRR